MPVCRSISLAPGQKNIGWRNRLARIAPSSRSMRRCRWSGIAQLQLRIRSALPTIEQLGALYADVLRAHAGSSPCVIAGYSLGGKIAFEAAHALQRAGAMSGWSFSSTQGRYLEWGDPRTDMAEFALDLARRREWDA